MAFFEQPPFPRGKTFGTTTATDGTEWEGREFWFEDRNWSGTDAVKPSRSERMIRCRVVRNSAAIALLPKRLVTYKTSTRNCQVDGYSTVTADWCRPVDEFLPSAGVAVNDLFYVVVEGPAMCLTDIATVDTISQGDCLVSLTGATSGATTSGRVDLADYSGATTPLAVQIKNCIGRAMSAKSTGNTNADILVDIGFGNRS